MKLSEMKFDERQELAELLEAWLSPYVDRVHIKVLNQLPQIVENEMAMKLLRELKARQDREKYDRIMEIKYRFHDLEKGKKIDQDASFGSSCLTHSKSYRDILYDLYIK